MPRLLNIIKKAGAEAVDSGSPCAAMFGQVICTNPLKIKVEQRLILGEKQLIKTDSVKDIQIDNSVVLLRMQGGQKFVVLNKIIE